MQRNSFNIGRTLLNLIQSTLNLFFIESFLVKSMHILNISDSFSLMPKDLKMEVESQVGKDGKIQKMKLSNFE